MEIYEVFYGRIYAYCLYRLFKKELAEDATSQVFLRFVEHFGSLQQCGKAEICQWLYRAASNLVSNQLRTASRRAEIAKEVARFNAARSERETFHAMDWPVLYEAILRLKPEQQDVIVLRYFVGLEPAQIAQTLAMKPVTARVTLSRAIKKLRGTLVEPLDA